MGSDYQHNIDRIVQESYKTGTLHINIGIFGILFNELPPGWNLITHQHRKDTIRFQCIVYGDLSQNPGIRIHGCFPQLVGIHLSKDLCIAEF